jgi:hypothetical protein
MELPPGTVDPLFLHELAEHLHMTVSELGDRMSAHELSVAWPAYFAYKLRQQERAEQQAERRKPRARL